MFENDLLNGGLILAVMAYLTTQLKDVGGTLYNWVKQRYTTKIVFDNSSPTYKWIEVWMNKHYSDMKIYHRRIIQRYDAEDKFIEDRDGEYDHALTEGAYILRYEGKRIVIKHTRERAAMVMSKEDSWYETISLTYWGTSQEIAKKIVAEAWSLATVRSPGKTPIFLSRYGEWEEYTRRESRELSTVILHEEIGLKLKEDVETFLSSGERYRELSIQWKRGYLLEGPPGNGKTSSIFALAAHLKMPIYMLHLPSVSGDNCFMGLIGELPSPCILLIEDIDTAFNGRKSLLSDEGVTYSCFLNVFDGVASKKGRIAFLTTNHPEKLDKALLRHGRIDRRFHYPNASRWQMIQLYNRFLPGSNGQAEAFAESLREGEHSMAEVQELLWQKVKD